MCAISVLNNKPARETKVITYRPITEAGVVKMDQWFKCKNWDTIFQDKNVDEKAHNMMTLIKQKTDEYFPLKQRKIASDNQPFFTLNLATLKRRKQREYNKNRKSPRWTEMDSKYRIMLNRAKMTFYKKETSKLKKSNPSKWYYWLKRLVSSDQIKAKELMVESINHLPVKEQAEILADNMSAVRNEYEPLKTYDIVVPYFSEEDIPVISVTSVETLLKQLKTNKSTPRDDIPPKIIKDFAVHISIPLTKLINSSIREGIWPDIFKGETVTPVPKSFPQKTSEDLRDITGLLTFNKIAEKSIGELIISDMKEKLDPSQYANQKGIGIQHYLINMLNIIFKALDSGSKGEVKAVIATFVDWKQAFPRQCPKLGISAFIACGVRPALIPLLINYFQNCKMKIKWKGVYSRIRKLNGRGPQGALFGILEYLGQSNDNAYMVNTEDRFKFVDDLTVLEMINLLMTEISS